MAGEDKKTEISPAPKETTSESKSLSGAKPSTTEGAQTPAASSSTYSRGEGQKPVSQAYRDNWNIIFAKKKSDNSPGAGERCGHVAVAAHDLILDAQARVAPALERAAELLHSCRFSRNKIPLVRNCR